MASRTIILLEDDVDGSRATRPFNLAVKGFRCYAVMRTSESSSRTELRTEEDTPICRRHVKTDPLAAVEN
jgi:hypothetical protein